VTLTSLDRTNRQRVRALRRPLLIGALVLLAALLISWSLATTHGYLDPDAADPQGGRALRVLLQDGGVTVHRVTTVEQATASLGGTGVGRTLVVNDAENLLPQQLSVLFGTAADLVLIGPDSEQLTQLVPELTAPRTYPGELRDAACAYPTAVRAGRAFAGGVAFSAAEGADVVLCYAADGKGTLAVVHRAGGRTITVVGLGDAFTNARLGDEGNAALGIGLLGADADLTWVVAQPALVGGQPGSTRLRDLLPRWVGLALLQLGVVVLLLAVWKGRRFGPVVVEPLPVVVRAAEATEGRARLYRRARARDRAAETLRARTRLRLTASLGVPAAAGRNQSSPDSLVGVAAARSGLPHADVAALLFGTTPPDDPALVRLVNDLDTLERTVRRT